LLRHQPREGRRGPGGGHLRRQRRGHPHHERARPGHRPEDEDHRSSDTELTPGEGHGHRQPTAIALACRSGRTATRLLDTPVTDRAARVSGRRVLGIALGLGTLVYLVDLLRWMVSGPLELRLLGPLLPAENRPEAEALLATLLGLGAFVAAGGLRRRWGPTLLAGGLTLAVCLANLRPTPSGDTAPATPLPFALPPP